MGPVGWLVVVAVSALALLALDRAVARGWFDRRAPRPRRTGGGPTGALGDLVELFQPSQVHLTAELERQQQDIRQTPDDAPARPGPQLGNLNPAQGSTAPLEAGARPPEASADPPDESCDPT